MRHWPDRSHRFNQALCSVLAPKVAGHTGAGVMKRHHGHRVGVLPRGRHNHRGARPASGRDALAGQRREPKRSGGASACRLVEGVGTSGDTAVRAAVRPVADCETGGRAAATLVPRSERMAASWQAPELAVGQFLPLAKRSFLARHLAVLAPEATARWSPEVGHTEVGTHR